MLNYKLVLKKVLLKFTIIFALAFIGPFLPLKVDGTAAFYFVSSVFQGTAAILGLFLVWYVFIDSGLWRNWFLGDTEDQKYTALKSPELICKALCLIALLMLTIFLSLVGLSITPIIIDAPVKAGLYFISLIFVSTCYALYEFMRFLLWEILVLSKK